MGSRDTMRTLKQHAWRIVADIEDPPPTKKEARALRDFFFDECVFCGSAVRRRSTDCLALIDPAGAHGVGNRVLACVACRGDRQPNEAWRSLLARRSGDDAAAQARRAIRIELWMRLHPLPPPMVGPEVAAIHARVEAALLALAAACNDLRAVRTTTEGQANGVPGSTATALHPRSSAPQLPVPLVAAGTSTLSEVGTSSRKASSAGHVGLRALKSRPRSTGRVPVPGVGHSDQKATK